MRRIFVDTLYWVAVTNRRDQWHQAAIKITAGLIGCHFVTTEEVLTEFLTAFCESGALLRQRTAATVRGHFHDQTITVLPQTHHTFLAGLALYETRLDKEYSLTDCISMETMRQEGITEILTHDDHFAQERFIKLL